MVRCQRGLIGNRPRPNGVTEEGLARSAEPLHWPVDDPLGVLSFSGRRPPGAIVAMISGVAVAIISFAAMVRFAPRKEAINLLLGLWLIAAPFALGFVEWNPLANYFLNGALLAGHATYQLVRPPKQRRGAL